MESIVKEIFLLFDPLVKLILVDGVGAIVVHVSIPWCRSGHYFDGSVKSN